MTILHPILGEIEIAKTALAELPIIEPEPQPVKMEETAPTPEPAKLNEPMVKAIPRFISNTPMEFVALLKETNSKVGFSFSDQASKRDQTGMRFFYNSRWENGNSNFRFNTDYRYRKTDGDVSDDRYTGNFRFRRQQEKNFFIQTTTFYRRDPLREIMHWAEQGAGAGWINKVSPNFEYSLGGEASVKFEELGESSDEIGGFNFLTSVFEDSVYQLGTNYQLIQEAEYFINPDDTESWGYRFDVKLDGKITSGFTVQLGYEYNFDNIVPETVPQKETLLSSALLYTF